MVRSDHLLNRFFFSCSEHYNFLKNHFIYIPNLPNHVRELIGLVKPKKVCVQYVYNTSD